MKVLFFFFLMSAMLLVGISGLIWYLLRMLFSLKLQPGSNAWDNLVKDLRNKVENHSNQLVPWDDEMLSLLSLKKAEHKGFLFSYEGNDFFKTIYDEPVIAFAQNSMKGLSLTLARTTKHEFILRKKSNETEIWVNQQPFAVFTNGVLLASGRNPRQLARLENNPDEVQFPLIIGEKTIAAINNAAKVDSPNPRAITLLKNLNSEEETIVLVLTLMILSN
jgi:hypothetical protein